MISYSAWSTVAAACTCQKHVTNVSQHGSMSKSDGAMPFSLSCHKVMNYSDSEPAQQSIDRFEILVDVGKLENYGSQTGFGAQKRECNSQLGFIRTIPNLEKIVLGLH